MPPPEFLYLIDFTIYFHKSQFKCYLIIINYRYFVGAGIEVYHTTAQDGIGVYTRIATFTNEKLVHGDDLLATVLVAPDNYNYYKIRAYKTGETDIYSSYSAKYQISTFD